MSTPSNAKFWLTRILVIFAVILSAVIVLNNIPEESTTSGTDPKMSAQQKMAENVSNFYSEFRQTSRDPIKERYGDYVKLVELSDKPIQQQISELSSARSSADGSWQGEFKERAFAKDSTLFTEAQSHILENGMNLIWALNQDFIIRHRFVSENTIAGMLSEVASAVDANFANTVEVYFCANNSTYVITDKIDEYLTNHCTRFIDNFQ